MAYMCYEFHFHVWYTEEVMQVKKCLIKNCLRLYFVVWLSWKQLNPSAYQVSSSCIQPLTSLRSEEVTLKKICLRLFVGCGRHGND